MVVEAGVVAPSRPRARWVKGPLADVATAFCWIPFAVAGAVLTGETLRTLVVATLLLSFIHQPLTLALVYGDPDQVRYRRRIFTLAPIALAVAVYAGLHLSFALVAAIGGLWNAEHTLMQRYGVTRIYGRKVGEDDGRLERTLLVSWLIVALASVAADPDLAGTARRVGLVGHNAEAIRLLAEVRPYALAALVPAAVVACLLTARWLVLERERWPDVNPAKHTYVCATALLFVTILVHPVAGFVGYVGSHAVEYFVIVHGALARRYVAPGSGGGALGRAARARTGLIGFLVIYTVVVMVAVAGLRAAASPLAYAVVFFTLGGLHIFYDGFIWKLRRPEVARSLGVEGAAAG